MVIDPVNRVAGPPPGTTTYALQTTGSWTALSHQSWCTVTPSGSGNGILTASYTANLSATPRVATITVTTAGAVKYDVTLTQKGFAPPVDLAATTNFKTVNLTWNAPPDAAGITGYNVYRYGVKINLAPVMNTSYSDTGLLIGKYKYTVTALYGLYESAHAGPVYAEAGVFINIGNGTSQAGYPYYTYFMGSRTQMIYLASDILPGGAKAGKFYTVGFNVVSAQAQIMQNFTIRMGMTTATTLSGWVSTGMNTVYAVNYGVPGTGWRDISLTTPFYWDGTSNVVVDICFGNNGSWTTNSNVLGTDAPGRTWHYHNDNYAGCTGTETGASESITPNIRFKADTTQQATLQPPTGLTAAVTNNNALLTWNAPVPSTGLIGYYLYRNGIQFNTIPVASSPYTDRLLANGTYSYMVSAVYARGESAKAGPAAATVSMSAPPLKLIAGSGFKNCIPLNWTESGAEFYRIYRRIGTSGNYLLIGNTSGYGTFSPASCYTDHSAEPGTTCYYKVTGVTGGIESNFSNEVSAVANLSGFATTAAYSELPPVIDGVISSAEWSDAIQFPVTNSLGVFNQSPTLPVTAYCKKVGNFLYIAVKDLSDVTNNTDEISLCFDNNGNQVFDGTDGNIWIDRITDSTVSVNYRPMTGTFPYTIGSGAIVANPAGITAAMSFTGGHREYELKIDLNNSPIHPVNNFFCHDLSIWNGNGLFSGFWPDGHVWPAPETYARMNVIATPAAAPVTTAGTVDATENSTISVPVNVTGFTDISAFTLRLQYNPLVTTFLGFGNVAAGLTGLTVYDVHLGPALHKLVISWSSTAPKNLSAGAKILDLVFQYMSGSSALTWNNVTNSGNDCEYYGPVGEPLPDIPTETYYINGLVQGLTSIVNVNNQTVENGQVRCFDAGQILNIAGSGTTFIVKSGGVATLIAGQKIFMFPGTKLQAGSFVQAYITTNGVFCNSMTIVPEIFSGDVVYEDVSDQDGLPFCKVYPNPTSGRFTVEADPGSSSGNISLTLYDMMGSVISEKSAAGRINTEMSLDGKPGGIYLLRISSPKRSAVVKVIRY